MTPEPDIPKPLRPSQAAELLGLHERTIRRYIADGRLDAYVVPGGHYRISLDAIRECLDCGRAAKERARVGRARDAAREVAEVSQRSASRTSSRKRRPRLGAETQGPGTVIDLSDEALRALAQQAA